MANIVSLNKARKKKAKAEKQKQAQENRVLFGRTKAERETQATIEERAKRKLDQHRRDEDPS